MCWTGGALWRSNNVYAARLAVSALSCSNGFWLAHLDAPIGYAVVCQHLGHCLGPQLGEFGILVGIAGGIDKTRQYHLASLGSQGGRRLLDGGLRVAVQIALAAAEKHLERTGFCRRCGSSGGCWCIGSRRSGSWGSSRCCSRG